MVGYHRETHHFREGKSAKDFYRPATHPIHFAADSPDKIYRYAAWAVFFFSGNLSGQSPSILLRKTVPLLKKTTVAFIATLRLQTQTVPWKFHKPSERDTDFFVNAAA